jgi:protein-L-isoaspartate(D-aspartate) O-methyltransferase
MEREIRLREAMVAQLERAGLLRSRVVASAMRAVPRHRFVPAVSMEDAYADRAIGLKMSDDDIISSISQPSMIAQMLDPLAAQADDRILEIGTGSGYNAALLAEIVGPGGAVTTIELDAEMGARASALLHELGYDRVNVRVADGATAVEESQAFDRIVVTARCDDISANWWEALREGGRMVIPLRLPAAGEFAVGFERRGDRLRGVGVYPCAFIALRGEAAEPVQEHVFFRDSLDAAVPRIRTIRSIEAVRAYDATPELLNEADVVVARAVTMFGIRFA